MPLPFLVGVLGWALVGGAVGGAIGLACDAIDDARKEGTKAGEAVAAAKYEQKIQGYEKLQKKHKQIINDMGNRLGEWNRYAVPLMALFKVGAAWALSLGCRNQAKFEELSAFLFGVNFEKLPAHILLECRSAWTSLGTILTATEEAYRSGCKKEDVHLIVQLMENGSDVCLSLTNDAQSPRFTFMQ